MFLFLYFGVLMAVVAVATGVLSWWWAAALVAAVFLIERKFVAASHMTDGDHALDEHGAFREPPAR